MKLFSDPTLQPYTEGSRLYNPLSTGDTFVARTLATDDTIIAWQSFRKIPLPASTDRQETITVLKLGSGVNGHVDLCHGGFISVLLDEIIGSAVDYIRPPGQSSMTAYLNVNYKKPVPTPGFVLCRGWVDSTDGRKIFGSGTIEDGEGTVMATGEALFLMVKKIPATVKL
jgi:acyl-coenzyme A thioesterase THEM4